MPFDGSGNFNRVMNWVNDALANIKILATRHDSEDDNFASGLSQCITKDGQTSITANIPFNGKRITGLANPVNPQDAMTLAQMTASNVRYDAAQSLTPAQQLQVHQNTADTLSVLAKSANYTLLQADRNKLLRITGSMNLTLPSAAAVGNDFAFDFRINSAAVTMTLVPNGTDQIEGVNANMPIIGSATGTCWSDGAGWLISLNADIPIVTFVTATNAAFALNKMTKRVEFELQAPGGGSGALAASSATTMGVVGGAGGGERCVLKVDNPNVATTWSITIGAVGAAAVAGVSVATAGGTCTVTDGGANTMTCIGGGPSASATPASAGFSAQGGTGGTGGTGGDANERIPGQNGGHGTNAGNQIIPPSGKGGDSKLGIGGMNYQFQGPALPGSGYGWGPTGPVSNVSQAAKNGLAGGPGVCIVREWR